MKKGNERKCDVLLGWRVVETCVETGWYDGITHVGDGAQLQDARAGRTRLGGGGEAGQDLPTLDDGRAVHGRDRGHVEERRGHEGMRGSCDGHLCTGLGCRWIGLQGL